MEAQPLRPLWPLLGAPNPGLCNTPPRGLRCIQHQSSSNPGLAHLSEVMPGTAPLHTHKTCYEPSRLPGRLRTTREPQPTLCPEVQGSSGHQLRAPGSIRVEETMEGVKPGGVLLRREGAMELNDIEFPLKDAVAKGDLLRELGSLQQLQGLQVGVEEGTGLQVTTQLALNDVAHGAVIRQPDEGRCVHEVGATGPGGHLQSQFAVDAEASSPGGKPELYQLCAVVRLRLRSVNWPIQARPAYIDVAGLGEGFQQLQQRPRVQIVVIVHMAEPSQPTGQEGIKFSSHLAGQGRVAVLRRAVGDHKVGPQSLLEAFIRAVSEDERLGMRKEAG